MTGHLDIGAHVMITDIGASGWIFHRSPAGSDLPGETVYRIATDDGPVVDAPADVVRLSVEGGVARWP